SGNPTFREILGRVRQVTLDAYAHQDLPFERLVEELQPLRSPGYRPLVQVMFVLQTDLAQSLKLPGLAITPVPLDTGTAKFDLTRAVEERPEGALVAAEFSADLFTQATIDRLLSHFQTLLEGIVANPTQTIGALPLLTEGERHHLLVEWNDTKTRYPRDRAIPQLFEEQAERTPDAVAVVFSETQLTYRELNERAN